MRWLPEGGDAATPGAFTGAAMAVDGAAETTGALGAWATAW